MSHEINNTDSVLVHTEQAWHGLGKIVRQDLTPREALTESGLDWGVRQEPVFRKIGGKFVEIESHVLNARADNDAQLGVVGSGYRPVQNYELADFAESLAKNDENVVVETCGSIRDGRKVWFLCRADAFTIGKTEDEVHPYLCLSNGHDGTASLRVTPTSVRVVCSNTLHMVIPQVEKDQTRFKVNGLAFAHVGDISARIDQAKQALAVLGESTKAFRSEADALAAKHARERDLQQFFAACYERDFGYEIPTNPKDKKEEGRAKRAGAAYAMFERRFESELDLSGASWWTALNAYTGMLQHDRPVQGADDETKFENRMHSNLMGLAGDRSAKAMATALELSA